MSHNIAIRVCSTPIPPLVSLYTTFSVGVYESNCRYVSDTVAGQLRKRTPKVTTARRRRSAKGRGEGMGQDANTNNSKVRIKKNVEEKEKASTSGFLDRRNEMSYLL